MTFCGRLMIYLTSPTSDCIIYLYLVEVLMDLLPFGRIMEIGWFIGDKVMISVDLTVILGWKARVWARLILIIVI